MSTRVAQADARGRITVSELRAHENYFVELKPGPDYLLIPRTHTTQGNRMIRVDSRKRISLPEVIPQGVYLITDEGDGVVRVSTAIVIPKRATND